jgi:hypothetical protein
MGFKLAELYTEIRAHDAHFRKQMSAIQRICGVTQQRMEKLGRAAKWMLLGLVGAGTLAVRAFAKQEEAERVLAQALDDTGQSAAAYLERLKQIAAATQQVTVYSDEQILQAMTLATNYDVLANEMEKFVQQAIGIVQMRGGQLKLADAIRYVVFAQRGLFGELSQSMPVLMTVNTQTEKMALFNKLAAQGWSQAQEAAKTTAGVFAQLKNLLSDLAETLGAALLPYIKDVVAGLKELLPGLIEWVKINKDAIARTALFAAKLLLIVTIAPKIIAALMAVGSAFRTVGMIIGFAAGSMGLGGAIAGLIGLLVGAGGLVYAARSAQYAWRHFREELAATKLPTDIVGAAMKFLEEKGLVGAETERKRLYAQIQALGAKRRPLAADVAAYEEQQRAMAERGQVLWRVTPTEQRAREAQPQLAQIDEELRTLIEKWKIAAEAVDQAYKEWWGKRGRAPGKPPPGAKEEAPRARILTDAFAVIRTLQQSLLKGKDKQDQQISEQKKTNEHLRNIESKIGAQPVLT